MTNEEKELLLVDLCARLPFKICANLPNHHLVSHKYIIHEINIQNGWTTGILDCAGRIQIYGAKVEDIKPYLRPMSSMTEEEKENLNLIVDEFGNKWMDSESPLDRWKAAFWEYSEATNYLHSIHVDYRGLIEKGVALEAPEGMYNKK